METPFNHNSNEILETRLRKRVLTENNSKISRRWKKFQHLESKRREEARGEKGGCNRITSPLLEINIRYSSPKRYQLTVLLYRKPASIKVI